jgi:5-methyltetrahydrofolate--homocysteine methyltransferase
MQENLKGVFESVVAGDRGGVETGVALALQAGTPPEAILKDGLVPAMDEVGRRFESCEFYVPEMMAAARAMKAGMTRLRPLLVQSGPSAGPRVVLGTVQGDMHDIGKSLVGMMLEGAGLEVHDLGTDVAPARFVQAVRDLRPSVVGLSALLTTTMGQMPETIAAIQAAGLRADLKVIVGGAPLTEPYAQSIGADGYAADASRAVSLTRRLLTL